MGSLKETRWIFLTLGSRLTGNFESWFEASTHSLATGRWRGWGWLATLTRTTLTILSLLLGITSRTRPRGHCSRGVVGSITRTRSPTSTFLRSMVHFLRLVRFGTYSVLRHPPFPEVIQNCLYLAKLVLKKVNVFHVSNLHRHVRSRSSKKEMIRRQRIRIVGVDTLGLELINEAISATTVSRTGSVTRWLHNLTRMVFLHVWTRRSHTPPKCGPWGGEKCHSMSSQAMEVSNSL